MARQGIDSEGYKEKHNAVEKGARAIESCFFCLLKSAKGPDSSGPEGRPRPPELTVVQRRIECPSGMIVSASSCKRTVKA